MGTLEIIKKFSEPIKVSDENPLVDFKLQDSYYSHILLKGDNNPTGYSFTIDNLNIVLFQPENEARKLVFNLKLKKYLDSENSSREGNPGLYRFLGYKHMRIVGKFEQKYGPMNTPGLIISNGRLLEDIIKSTGIAINPQFFDYLASPAVNALEKDLETLKKVYTSPLHFLK